MYTLPKIADNPPPNGPMISRIFVADNVSWSKILCSGNAMSENQELFAFITILEKINGLIISPFQLRRHRLENYTQFMFI